jgi:hypothetical protein
MYQGNFLQQYTLDVTFEWVAFPLHSQEVLDSSLGLQTSYFESAFSVVPKILHSDTGVV